MQKEEIKMEEEIWLLILAAASFFIFIWIVTKIADKFGRTSYSVSQSQ